MQAITLLFWTALLAVHLRVSLSAVPLLSTILTGVIGLIPNCAASVVITQMYLEGLLTCGELMAGLLVGAGVGLLVLFLRDMNA